MTLLLSLFVLTASQCNRDRRTELMGSMPEAEKKNNANLPG